MSTITFFPCLRWELKPAIMELPEIKAAIRAIRNLDNLPIPRISSALNTQDDNSEYRDKSINDILDWLASIYGFQVSSGC